MADYNSINCPICDKRFTAEDDIVVCPVCGAPHHRDCWKEHGKCQFEELHEEGFVWKRPRMEFSQKSEEDASSSDRPVACIRCGTVNEAGRLFCKNCGVMLSDNSHRENVFENNTPRPIIIDFNDPLGGVKPDENFDGVSAKNLAEFIGRGSNYFIRIFKLFKDRSSKIFFNAFAFVFTGCWFISKKMYGLGFSLVAVMFGLKCSQIFFIQKYLAPVYDVIKDMTQQESYAYMLTLSPFELIKMMLPYAFIAASWVIMLLCGLFANLLYKKYCIKSIKSVKNSDESVLSAVKEKKGGVNMIMAVSVYISSYLLSSLFQTLII